MKKGEIGVGNIEKVEFPNKGILHTQEGEKVIVKNCLPGQKVRFIVQKRRRGKCEGRLLEVLERSPGEKKQPFCVHFENCGGCLYQRLNYEDQLALKESQVKDLFQVIDGKREENSGLCKKSQEERDYEDKADESRKQADSNAQIVLKWFEGMKPSPQQFGYRNKMEFSFGDEYKDGPLALGLHKRGSFYDLVTTDHCRIADTDYNQILQMTLSYFSNAGVRYFKKTTHQGYLRHLLVRKAIKTGEILVVLVTTTQYYGHTSEEILLSDFWRMLIHLPLEGKIVGVLHTKNDSVADIVKDEGTEILYGQDFFYEELLGLKFKISPFSFFQTNSLGAEVLYETVREYINQLDDNRASTVFDLYSGTGTIAQIIAPAAGKVIGVEIVQEAVSAARENAVLNGLDNCEFIAGDVLKVLDEIEDRPDFIILDPPREGVHPKALQKIIAYGVERMVYISCQPTSLVRDLNVLLANGYEIKRGCCVDMFPGAGHVETIVSIQKKDS